MSKIGGTRSAANYPACSFSDRELNDIGYRRSTFISKSVGSVIRELDAADKCRNKKAIRTSSLWSTSGIWGTYRSKAAN